MPLDDFCDLLTIQAVGADFIEENPDIFDNVRAIVAMNSPLHGASGVPGDGDDGPRAARRAARRPILFTNGTRDIMTPPDLAPSGYSARQIVEPCPTRAAARVPRHRPRRPARGPDEAVEVVTAFFQEVLEAEQR